MKTFIITTIKLIKSLKKMMRSFKEQIRLLLKDSSYVKKLMETLNLMKKQHPQAIPDVALSTNMTAIMKKKS